MYKIKIISAALISLILIAFLKTYSSEPSDTNSSIYQFNVKTIDGKNVSLSEYKGKVMLIVNVASYCGYTPHYTGLQALYDKYEGSGLIVLGFPCNQFGEQEPGTNEEISDFCTSKYNVTFPMFSKIDVNGANAHPLYKYLVANAGGFKSDTIKWNFTKFLVSHDGSSIIWYSHRTLPDSLEPDIVKLIHN